MGNFFGKRFDLGSVGHKIQRAAEQTKTVAVEKLHKYGEITAPYGPRTPMIDTQRALRNAALKQQQTPADPAAEAGRERGRIINFVTRGRSPAKKTASRTPAAVSPGQSLPARQHAPSVPAQVAPTATASAAPAAPARPVSAQPVNLPAVPMPAPLNWTEPWPAIPAVLAKRYTAPHAVSQSDYGSIASLDGERDGPVHPSPRTSLPADPASRRSSGSSYYGLGLGSAPSSARSSFAAQPQRNSLSLDGDAISRQLRSTPSISSIGSQNSNNAYTTFDVTRNASRNALRPPSMHLDGASIAHQLQSSPSTSTISSEDSNNPASPRFLVDMQRVPERSSSLNFDRPAPGRHVGSPAQRAESRTDVARHRKAITGEIKLLEEEAQYTKARQALDALLLHERVAPPAFPMPPSDFARLEVLRSKLAALEWVTSFAGAKPALGNPLLQQLCDVVKIAAQGPSRQEEARDKFEQLQSDPAALAAARETDAEGFDYLMLLRSRASKGFEIRLPTSEANPSTAVMAAADSLRAAFPGASTDRAMGIRPGPAQSTSPASPATPALPAGFVALSPREHRFSFAPPAVAPARSLRHAGFAAQPGPSSSPTQPRQAPLVPPAQPVSPPPRTLVPKSPTRTSRTDGPARTGNRLRDVTAEYQAAVLAEIKRLEQAGDLAQAIANIDAFLAEEEYRPDDVSDYKISVRFFVQLRVRKATCQRQILASIIQARDSLPPVLERSVAAYLGPLQQPGDYPVALRKLDQLLQDEDLLVKMYAFSPAVVDKLKARQLLLRDIIDGGYDPKPRIAPRPRRASQLAAQVGANPETGELDGRPVRNSGPLRKPVPFRPPMMPINGISPANSYYDMGADYPVETEPVRGMRGGVSHGTDAAGKPGAPATAPQAAAKRHAEAMTSAQVLKDQGNFRQSAKVLEAHLGHNQSLPFALQIPGEARRQADAMRREMESQSTALRGFAPGRRSAAPDILTPRAAAQDDKESRPAIFEQLDQLEKACRFGDAIQEVDQLLSDMKMLGSSEESMAPYQARKEAYQEGIVRLANAGLDVNGR
ncbi:MAG: hypothetical protein ACRYGK_16980 [Janthinobacterium lividum]